MKKLIILSFIITSLFSGIKEEKIDFSEYDRYTVKELLRVMHDEVSKVTPIKIDEYTTFLRTIPYENTFIYIKEIDVANKDLKDISFKHNSKMHNSLFQTDRNVVCNEKILRYLVLDRKAIIMYRYVDKNFKTLFEHTIETSDCNNLK